MQLINERVEVGELTMLYFLRLCQVYSTGDVNLQRLSIALKNL